VYWEILVGERESYSYGRYSDPHISQSIIAFGIILEEFLSGIISNQFKVVMWNLFGMK
jgi:hypothetical protein